MDLCRLTNWLTAPNSQPESDWLKLSSEGKKEKLFWKQKNLLDTFLLHGAISKAQYDKSLSDMSQKMGIAVQ